ncbi:MAG: toll/interleukin-1 receptor domain-containing protein, partial [Clostridia bacterium]|nr:toll/interleukin-1 receptor domain-containing protein [Clostridia bacterium]
MVAYKGKEKYIFVSYAHKDSERVLPILEAMQRAGFRVWYDTGIEAGTEWPAYIEESLEKSSVVIAFLSPHSVESVNCRNEINYALLKQKEMLVIYLEDTELRYGLGLQLNSLQSLFKFRHQT